MKVISIVLLFIVILSLVSANAGDITSVSVTVTVTVTPEECMALGYDCIKNLLCQATTCYEKNNAIYVEWIW